MGLRLFKMVFSIVLAVAAVGLMVWAGVGLAANHASLRDALPYLLTIIGSLAGGGSLIYALLKETSVFKGFRIVYGAAAGILVAWLLLELAVDVVDILGTNLRTASLTTPAIKLIVAIGIAAIFYFSVVAQTGVRRILENIFSIPELLKKLAFTLALLCIYRVGYHIPLPGLDQTAITSFIQRQEGGAFGQALQYFAMFTGGNLQQSTLFGLGIMPYISASIILQLLVTVVPALEKLKKEGQAGYRKIQEYTRYLTVLLCVIQAIIWVRVMCGGDHPLVYGAFSNDVRVMLMGVLGLTAGTMFLMWLGEQIDEYGIGNGISLIIMAGIVSRLPWAIRELIGMSSLKVTGAESSQIGLIKIIFLIGSFLFVVAGSILISQAQRRIPIQQAKQTRGRRVYGGQRQYLPLRVNHGGVMPIIFASSLLIFPNAIFKAIQGWKPNGLTNFLAVAFQTGDLVYELTYVALIFFFAYFWTTVQFRPKDMSEQLQDYGSFIPGLRPGKRTEDYLQRVMERITYCGAGFLAVIAVIPQAINQSMGIPFQIAAFLGGTGLLITVSVALDLVQRIEANLIMRNYGGFLGDTGRIKGAYS